MTITLSYQHKVLLVVDNVWRSKHVRGKDTRPKYDPAAQNQLSNSLLVTQTVLIYCFSSLNGTGEEIKSEILQKCNRKSVLSRMRISLINRFVNLSYNVLNLKKYCKRTNKRPYKYFTIHLPDARQWYSPLVAVQTPKELQDTPALLSVTLGRPGQPTNLQNPYGSCD